MAISGSGGWVPSFGVKIAPDGSLQTTGYAQNKPKEIVEMDMTEAIEKIGPGVILQVDTRNGNFPLLCALWDARRNPVTAQAWSRQCNTST